MRLTAVYIPTNHVYVGDIYLLDERDIIHTNLTVREGLGKHQSTVIQSFMSIAHMMWQQASILPESMRIWLRTDVAVDLNHNLSKIHVLGRIVLQITAHPQITSA